MKNNLRTIRKKYNLTQQQVAEKMQMTKSTISRYESQSQRLDINVINKLSQAIGCDPLEIIADKGKICLTEEEERLIANFRKLNSVDKVAVSKKVNALAKKQDLGVDKLDAPKAEKSLQLHEHKRLL